jgi:hypothetical protein
MYGFFRGSNERRPGMLESDLDKFETGFDLRKREDGTERGQRPSAWLTYQRKSIENQRQISS